MDIKVTYYFQKICGNLLWDSLTFLTQDGHTSSLQYQNTFLNDIRRGLKPQQQVQYLPQ